MYVTQANLEAKLGRVLTAEELLYFTNVLSPGVDAYINLQTETIFGSTDVVDVYMESDPDSSTLIIPTMHDITAVAYVEPDGTEEVLSLDEYYTYPRGTGAKYAIKKLNSTWNSDEDGTYKITGKLGYETVPADVKAVALELATAGITANVNGYKSEKVGDWSVIYNYAESRSKDYTAELSKYRRISRSF